MNLYPAIDILGGQAVRLTKGEFDAKKVYDRDPLAVARGFAAEGARHLHVIDLDGAREGAPVNARLVARIASEAGLPVQYGGGLRSAGAIDAALSAGVSRAILGTVAFTAPGVLAAALESHGAERVVVSVDARGGCVATHGWLSTSDAPVAEVVERLRADGVRHFVYTDIDRDGMLEGPDREGAAAVSRAAGERSLILSGGVGTLAHLRALAGLPLDGVIVGKALYERRFTVAEAIAALRNGS